MAVPHTPNRRWRAGACVAEQEFPSVSAPTAIGPNAPGWLPNGAPRCSRLAAVVGAFEQAAMTECSFAPSIAPPGTLRPGETTLRHVGERRANPFTGSKTGGKILSALQLPFFTVRPPHGYGVITTTGRTSGKRRRRCVRVIDGGAQAALVAIKGKRTGWAANALANGAVRLRLPRGTFTGTARQPTPDEVDRLRTLYCDTVTAFDSLTYRNWRTGRPTKDSISALLANWFDTGTPIVVDLTEQ